MANNKHGFAYYNADTDRFLDIRIKRLKKDFGCTGFTVYEYILNEIYRVKGCFLVWDESTAFDVAEYWGLKENTVNEIVNYCGVVGLFDRELLTRGGILSSRSIQSRFIDMCVRSKRKDFKIPEECQILPEESIKPPEECTQNSGSLPQSRVEKSKEEESITPLPPKGKNIQDFFLTKKKRKLSGKRLETFLIFLNKFNYSNGKAAAADSWLDIPELTNVLCEKIYTAAEAEAKRRPELEASGKTPKMAQGWLTDRRWEDEIYTKKQVDPVKQTQRAER